MVKVSPRHDTIAETTSVAAADIIVDILAAMVEIRKACQSFKRHPSEGRAINNSAYDQRNSPCQLNDGESR